MNVSQSPFHPVVSLVHLRLRSRELALLIFTFVTVTLALAGQKFSTTTHSLDAKPRSQQTDVTSSTRQPQVENRGGVPLAFEARQRKTDLQLGLMSPWPVFNRYLAHSERKAPALAMTPPVGASPTTAGLVAYYKFDEGVGSSTADSSGHSLTGQLLGPSWTNADLPDILLPNVNALSFNGTSNSVLIPPAAINDLSSGTITAWVYLNTRDQEVITAKQDDRVDSMAVFAVGLSGNNGGVQTPGVLYFHAKNATGFNAAGVTVLNTGEWYHVGVTFTPTQAKIYVDGILDSTTNGDFSVPSDLGNSAFTTIGAWLGDGPSSLDGRLDEVRTYDRALSDSEMAGFSTSSQFSINAITPNKGENSGDISVSVTGGGFRPGATVKLRTAGQPDIEGVSTIVVRSSRIRTTFNLQGATLGSRDVVVTLPDGSSAILPGGFTIEASGKAPPTNGLVAYYKFDEGVGSSTADSSSNSLTGQLLGPSWTNTDLPFILLSNQNALSFNGTSDSVLIPPAAINDLSSGTITAWVYLNSRDQEVITAKQHNRFDSMAVFAVGLSGYYGGVQTPGVLYFHAKNATGFNAASVTALNTGQWYHVGVTFTSTQAKIYINGILDSTTSGDFSIPSDLSNSTITTIGAWLGDGFSGTNSLDGRLDEVRVYDHALSDSEMAEFVTSSQFFVREINANKGGNSGDVTVSVLGGGFQSGATVKLRSPGQPDIEGANATFINRSRIRTTFDLRGITPGLRDVIVTLPDGSSATLPAGFTIEEGAKAQVWVDIIGRDTIRVGRPQTYTIIYGNRGNVDAVGVPLWIAGIPKNAILNLGFEVVAPVPLEGQAPIDWREVPIHIEMDDEKLLPLFVPIISPGSTGLLSISLTVPTQQEFQLRAWTNPPFFQSPINPQVVDCGVALGNAVLEGLGIIPGVGCGVTLARVVTQSFVNTVNYERNSPSAGTSQAVFSFLQLSASGISEVAAISECAGRETPVLGSIIASFQLHLAAIEAYDKCNEPFRKLREAITQPIRTVASRDPNDKVGSQGTGSAHYLSGAEPLRYAVYFENVDTATAPAADVIVRDNLDISKFKLDTFSLGPIIFGNKQVIPPPGSTDFNTNVDLRPERNLVVKINAHLEVATGLLIWRFSSIDPNTGLPPEDPSAGFLAPGEEGSVIFTVFPKSDLATGTVINNRSSIVFDNNAPLETPTWSNTLDNSIPASSVRPLAATLCSPNFNVQWSGTDAGSGIRDYAVYVSDNGGPFTIWQSNTTATSAIYNGHVGHTYAFYSVARDQTGNLELGPGNPDAVTVIDNTAPVITLKGRTITLWSPNHKYETVRVADLVAGATDNCDGGVNLSKVVISQVSSDEPDNGSGDGDASNDIVIAPDCKSVQLRAERDGKRNGRVYTITYKVKDNAGRVATAVVKVTVPKSQNGNPATDDGPSHTIISACP